MISLIARRLLQMPLILLVIYSATLTLSWVLPGSPLESGEGRRPPPEVIEQMEAQYNLNNPWKFYVSYLDNALGIKYARDTITGTAAVQAQAAEDAGVAPPPRLVFNLGPSTFYRDWNVNEIIGAALPISITLGASSILIALVIGVLAGVVGAVKPNSFADLATLSVALVGISLPSFVIGTTFLLLFGVWLSVLPVAGWGGLERMILPAVTLSLPFAAYIARLTRIGMIDAMTADYVRTARAKGCRERAVLLRHALKNALLPVLSYLGPATAYAMTGSFVVERVFSVPGIGQHFVNAVQNKDQFLLIGVVLVFASLLILLNLAVDVLYRFVDPRIDT